MSDRVHQIAVLLLALLQPATTALLFANGFEVGRARPPVPLGDNPAVPAGYAFAIWTPIFIGSILFALVHALPANRADPLFRRIGWASAAGFALCSAWLVAAATLVWPTIPVIVAMLAMLGFAFVTAARAGLARQRNWLVTAPLALYAGWLTAATFANIGSVAPGYGFDRFGLSAESFGIGMIAAASGVGIAVARAGRWHPVYIGALLWALIAIVVRNGAPSPDAPVSLAAAIAAAALAGLAFVGHAGRRTAR